jgi:hypothetical protein
LQGFLSNPGAMAARARLQNPGVQVGHGRCLPVENCGMARYRSFCRAVRAWAVTRKDETPDARLAGPQ